MNKAKLYMFISISILVFSISGTLALYIWRSTTNALVNLEVCAPIITFVGGSTINGEDLIPVLSKENGLKKEIKVKLNKTCQDGDSAVMNLYMSLDLLPKELQEDTFIYELYQDNELVVSGNFKGKSEGETIRFAENEIVTTNELTYTLYIYIDGKRDNPITMSNKPFRFYLYGEGTDAIYEENYIRSRFAVNADSLFLNTDIKRKEIESIKTVDNNTVPDNIDKSFDISSNEDGSVMLWYEDSNNNNLYEVYMGSFSGLIKLNTDGSFFFANLTNATEIDVSKLDTSNTTNMHYMFADCKNLKSLNISNFNTSKVTDMNRMFLGCSSLTNLNLSNFDTFKVTSMDSMFASCTRLLNLNISNFNTQKVSNMKSLFYACPSLMNLDLSNFDTSNVTDMSNMFRGCSSLKKLDVSNFITKEVTNMEGMFQDCSLLTDLDLSSFDTEKVDNMVCIFYRCFNLVSIKLNSFNTKNVNDMGHMFDDCSSLTNLDLSSFDTSNVTSMYQMFDGCKSLTNLDLTKFNTEKVTNMGLMFNGCNKLATLDLRNADFSNVTSYNNMFASVPTSLHIYVKDSIQRDWLLERFPKFENIVVV